MDRLVADAYIYPGTPITWLPDWLALVWRVGLWIAILIIVIRMTTRAIKGTNPSLSYGRAALVILLCQQLVTNAERFGDPLTFEGSPITTIAVVFAWRALEVTQTLPPPDNE